MIPVYGVMGIIWLCTGIFGWQGSVTATGCVTVGVLLIGATIDMVQKEKEK